MMERIQINNGTGLVDIRGRKEHAAFYLKGALMTFAIEIDYNTLMNYFAGNPVGRNFLYEDWYNEVKPFLEGKPSNKKMVKLFEPVLQQLSNGAYELSLEKYENKHQIIYSEGKEVNSQYAGCEPFALFATQGSTNSKVIEKYEELIKKGAKPKVIILKIKEGRINFILDGHHKAQAYINTGMPIEVLEIRKCNNLNLPDNYFKKVAKTFDMDKEAKEVLKSIAKQ